MNRKEAADFLRIPYPDIVSLALNAVSLNNKERQILRLRHIEGYTQEKTAELLDVSSNSIQNWEYQALDRCCTVWQGLGWVEILLNNKEQM